jgi:ribosomal subunit interface protein
LNIDITAQGFSITENLRDHVHRRLSFALGRFDDRIQRLSVKLENVNGSSDGTEMECRVIVQLSGMPNVVVKQDGPDAHSAVDQAADRVGNTVARKLERLQSNRSPDQAAS